MLLADNYLSAVIHLSHMWHVLTRLQPRWLAQTPMLQQQWPLPLPPSPLTDWLPELVTCGTEIVLQLYQAEIVLPNPLVTISCFARNSLDLLFQHTEAGAPPVLIFYCWTDVWFTRINTTLINSSVAVISVFSCCQTLAVMGSG